MRSIFPQGKCVPIKSSRTNFHQAVQVRDESQLPTTFVNGAGQMQQQNDTVRSKFFTEVDAKRSNWDPELNDPKDGPLLQVPNNVTKPENLAGPSEVRQLSCTPAQRQRLMILELQEQFHNLIVIHQQNRQKFLKERAEAQATQVELVVDAAKDTQMLPEYADDEVSTDDLSPPCVSNQLIFYGAETVQVHSRQCNRKDIITRSKGKLAIDAAQTPQSKKVSQRPGHTNRVERSGGSLRRKKQVRSNLRKKRCDSAVGKNSVVGKSEFSLPNNLLQCNHCRPYFKEQTTYSCGVCDKAFPSKSRLKKHLRVHSGGKPFKCTNCDSAFSDSSNLTRHQLVHSNVKPFKCQICRVAFTHKHNLSGHLMIHTNEKPFLCDICKRSFRHKRILVDHMNIHSGRRPYQCNVCNKTFRQKSNFYSHRTVHRERE